MLERNDFVFLLCLPSSAGPPPAVPHGHKGAAAAANITRSRKRIQRSDEQWGPQSWRPALEWVPLQIPPLLSLTGGVSTNIHQHGPSPGGMRSAGSASVLTPTQEWGGLISPMAECNPRNGSMTRVGEGTSHSICLHGLCNSSIW